MKKSIRLPGFLVFKFGSRIEEKTAVSDRINKKVIFLYVKAFVDEKIKLIVDRKECESERSGTKNDENNQNQLLKRIKRIFSNCLVLIRIKLLIVS